MSENRRGFTDREGAGLREGKERGARSFNNTRHTSDEMLARNMQAHRKLRRSWYFMAFSLPVSHRATLRVPILFLPLVDNKGGRRLSYRGRSSRCKGDKGQ